ncbi:hypothetical protein [Devosia nitrariae]|nr:hypothetical protein [Devosia nitrariae]
MILFMLMIAPGLAQTAVERASELKTWREQCSDPDADLRAAYVEAAIASGDMAIMRVCVRQSLESDNADIRNLGLRAAIASTDQLLFEVEIPAALAEALDKAGNDKDELNEIGRWHVTQMWNIMRTGLVFVISDADITSGASEWLPLAQMTAPHRNYTGKASVIGDRVTWVGSARLPVTDCRLNLGLVSGPMLEGTFQCANVEPFTVRAPLL